jgi:hypothetical protein
MRPRIHLRSVDPLGRWPARLSDRLAYHADERAQSHSASFVSRQARAYTSQ